MIEVLRIAKGFWRGLNLYLFNTLYFWTAAYVSHLVTSYPSYHDFLVLFAHRWLLLYISCGHGGA
jgi:hypothetical protein